MKLSATLVGVAPMLRAWRLTAAGVTSSSEVWPSYLLRREQDELFLELTAVGFREVRRGGRRWLSPLGAPSDSLLVYTFGPQHFAETALATTLIPTVFEEDRLGTIELLASDVSRLVFRMRDDRSVRVALSDLLNWQDFDLVLPNLDTVASDYSLGVVEPADEPFTRVEMPWGIALTPVVPAPPLAYRWFHSRDPQVNGDWRVLWTTALAAPPAQNEFEVLDVRGFVRTSTTGSAERGDLRIVYDDEAGTVFPRDPTPIRNEDRIEIAASLSRRFDYTGVVGPPPIESAVIEYSPSNTRVSACYADGRTVSVDQFRLSARGGWLQLDGQWVAFPGCGLTGWVHTASLGRDHHVELVNAGFLYPFGTACELVILSERVFVKDTRGHYVAVLIKQVFLQIPQPNDLIIGHDESIFRSVGVTTRRTPPLDIPATGDPATYRDYDFFLPLVDGTPFSFEHVGTDWAGERHGSSMPMYFVSNKARSANGLIWEPGYPWCYSQSGTECESNGSDSSEPHVIPKSGDKGFRVLDELWNTDPFRFAKYNGALLAVAVPRSNGDTSQRIEWVEWVRGSTPALNPTEVVTPPFRPRTRTMRVRIEGIGQMSGQPSSSLVTYRDTRFVTDPVLDPEPTADPLLYFRNVNPNADDPVGAYLFTLETRSLVEELGTVTRRTRQQQIADIRDLYYGTSIPSRLPADLFPDVDNELRFGLSASSEGVGGLSVPDTHVSTLTRRNGPIGDATFNEDRWDGYSTRKSGLESIGRLDYAAYRKRFRSHIDSQPFDRFRQSNELDALTQSARAVMGFSANLAPAAVRVAGSQSTGLRLGDLFGKNAQVLPGLSFADLFSDVPLGSTENRSVGAPAAEPPSWQVRVTGIEWITTLIGTGPGQLSLGDLISQLEADAQNIDTSQALPLGLEARLNWANDVFSTKKIGPVVFTPNTNTRMTMEAIARVDLGTAGVPIDLSQVRMEAGSARVSAKAELRNFEVTVFSAIEVLFSSVSFELSADGKKNFSTNIEAVNLIGALSFIGQLSSILGGLGNDQGITLDLSPQRIRIAQTLRFPPTEGEPLFLGPAQIINLALGWSVMIPLRGRDVLSIGFAVSSREKPLTIFVPPWYGGKAHVLLEVTTKGCRLVEVCMEYGALIPIRWGIASGEASLMAGIFYSCERDDATNSGKVTMRAFVKACADLSVAGIIHFAGLILISLTYVEQAGRKLVRGAATVRVSIKIGFVRVSYSFTAAHEEESGGGANAGGFVQPAIAASTVSSVNACHTSVSAGPAGDIQPFGSGFDLERRAAFRRILAAYATADRRRNAA